MGQTDITGFNGAGTVEGDQIHFMNNPGDQAKLDVSTQGGKTIFDLTTPFGTSTHVTVDAVGSGRKASIISHLSVGSSFKGMID